VAQYADDFLDLVVPLCENSIRQVGVIRKISALQLTESQKNFVTYFEVQSYSGGIEKRAGGRAPVDIATVEWAAYGKIAKDVQEIPSGSLVMVRGEHWQPRSKTTVKQLMRIARRVAVVGSVTNGLMRSGHNEGEALQVDEG